MTDIDKINYIANHILSYDKMVSIGVLPYKICQQMPENDLKYDYAWFSEPDPSGCILYISENGFPKLVIPYDDISCVWRVAISTNQAPLGADDLYYFGSSSFLYAGEKNGLYYYLKKAFTSAKTNTPRSYSEASQSLVTVYDAKEYWPIKLIDLDKIKENLLISASENQVVVSGDKNGVELYLSNHQGNFLLINNFNGNCVQIINK